MQRAQNILAPSCHIVATTCSLMPGATWLRMSACSSASLNKITRRSIVLVKEVSTGHRGVEEHYK